MTDPAGELILYRADDGGSVVQLRATKGTVWLTQAQMAELYGTSVPNIVQIMRRVLADEEVTEATINSELVVRVEGGRQVRREVKVYNLDMILAVGYRVTTPRAVQFRQWATTVLTEYLVKGFAMQDERLKVYADYDNRRRAVQAEEARRQEEQDLAELLEIERRDRHGGGSLDHDASAG
ncbi:virulence RhuM family protein [Micromonospora arborensis]|uniref:virulence RhuM family protein n=1 Tax=Micromonospora arborensis TaxID=2116518 RepID=UPI001ABFA14E|nr:RhuM family protein [Micromonospora arborensis]